MIALETELKKCGERIDELTAKKASTDQLMKLEREVNDQGEK